MSWRRILIKLYQYLLLNVFSFKTRPPRKWCFLKLKHFVTKQRAVQLMTYQTSSLPITQTLQLKFRLLSKRRPNNHNYAPNYATTKNNRLNTNTVKFQITVSDIVSIDMQTQCYHLRSSKNSFCTPVKINSFSHKLPHALSVLCVRVVLPRNSHEVIFQVTAQRKVFRLFAFFVKRSAKTTRMASTEEEFRQVSYFIYMHFYFLFLFFYL